MAEPRRAFVCGHPIAHSRSPLIHGHWLRALGIREGHYHPVDIAPADFAGFLSSLGAQTSSHAYATHIEATLDSLALHLETHLDVAALFALAR